MEFWESKPTLKIPTTKSVKLKLGTPVSISPIKIKGTGKVALKAPPKMKVYTPKEVKIKIVNKVPDTLKGLGK